MSAALHNAWRLTSKSAGAQLTYRNQGGFHMIGSGRDKIESAEDLERAAAAVTDLALDGLIVAGGDDSNTNAAVLAEYFLARGAPWLGFSEGYSV